MVKSATHFFVDSQGSPELRPCKSCGAQAMTYLDTDNLGLTANQPFVYVQCQQCALTINSGQVFGDLSNASLLDKLSRVTRLWNHVPSLDDKRHNSI